MTILSFKHEVDAAKARRNAPDPLKCQCFNCQKSITKRSVLNSPAFCSYECGAAGQPEHAKAGMRNTIGGNNPKS